MHDQKHIKYKFERAEKALTLKPSLGIDTAVSVTKIEQGVACVSREGPFELRTDLPEGAGGKGSNPTPGVLGRAALGSCLAMSYMLWASKLDIPIDEVEVHVEADYDDGAMYGISDAPPGYTEIRYLVKVKSSAPEADIMSMITTADKHGPYLDVFSRGQTCLRTIEIDQS